jgi:hypothetical protein
MVFNECFQVRIEGLCKGIFSATKAKKGMHKQYLARKKTSPQNGVN